MEFLTIIPARGGSRGIPGKNIRDVAGQPLIAWTIQAAQQAKQTHHIVVSTDDQAIAETARQYGAEVIMRPAELAGDSASSESALIHAVESWTVQHGYRPDGILFLQCTSPLTAPEDMDAVISKISEEQADCALTVTPFHYFLWKNEKEQAVGINHHAGVRPLRQEREPQFIETGAAYAMKTDGFLENKHRFFGRIALVEMPAERVLEIDDPPDLERADYLLRLRAPSKSGLPTPCLGVVFDFDGVFTDNSVYVDENGRESVRCHRGDGMGITQLKKCGIPILVLSSEENPIVTHRCKKLNIECIHHCANKWPVLKEWAKKQAIDIRQIAYVGNDINDIECLQKAGCGVAVADAAESAKQAADIILIHNGGHGAVREMCDLIRQQF